MASNMPYTGSFHRKEYKIMDDISYSAESYRQSIGEEFLITYNTQTVPKMAEGFTKVSEGGWMEIIREEVERVGVAKTLAQEMGLRISGPPCIGCEQAANGLCDPQCMHFKNVSGV
jgi:hypothetical protein